MEIILNDQSYELLEKKEFLEEMIKDIKDFDKNATYESCDIGRGADWPVILAIYSSIASTIGMISAIPAIIEILKKFQSHFVKMKKKYGRLKICEECARTLAINYIFENENEYEIKDVRNVFNKNIPINPPIRNKKIGNLSDNPDSYYFLIYHVILNNENEFGEFLEKYYHFIIKSDGVFELSHILEIPKWYDF